MAVVSCSPIWPAKCSVDLQLNRTYEKSYRVITDTINDGGVTVLRAPGLPALFTPFVNQNGEFDTGVMLKHYDPQQDSRDPTVWIVSCFYESWALHIEDLRGKNPELQQAISDLGQSTTSQEQPGGFDAQDPISRPPRVSLGFRPYQKAAWVDLDKKPITNSAGERFDPPLTQDDNRLYMQIVRNEAGPLDVGRMRLYQDAVNSDTFLGQGPGTAKMRMSATRQFENNKLFWEVTYDIEFTRGVQPNEDAEFWDVQLVLDAGYHTLRSTQSPPGDRILDPSGIPCASPMPLYTVVGNENPPLSGSIGGDIVALPPGYKPQFREFRFYRTLPFAVFNLAVNF